MLITVTSHKGGVGKTTSAMHLAAYLAQEYGGQSVALVDTDPNESALDIASRGAEVGSVDLPFKVMGPEDQVAEEYVIFDSQGRLHGEDLEAAAEMSDLLVVPTTPDYLEIRALGHFIEDLDEVGGARYKVLLTMVPWYERLYCPGRAELEAGGVPMFQSWVEGRKAFKHAAAAGKPVYAVKGKAARNGWQDYEKVGAEMVADLVGVRS